MASVDVEKVDKFYGSTQVLFGVEVGIEDGEFVVLVGPSGCGKSTLLRMIAGLEEISAGQIQIGGRVVNNVPPKDRDIAMVFQNYALYPHMTVQNNMAFSLKLAKAPKDEIKKRVDRAAQILGLGPYLDRYPRQLSGGQRQRVAMGRAIVRDPQVFLFDEPLSNLDAKLRVQMRTEIKELHQRLKTTSIYVTHDQIEAMTMADRIVVMHDGIVEQNGAPLELYDHPANLFVAGFIGSPAMNFIDATIKRNGGAPSAVAADGTVLPLAPGCRRPGRPEGGLRHPPRASQSRRRRRWRGRRGLRGRADRCRDPGVQQDGRAGNLDRVPRAAPVRAGPADPPRAQSCHGPSVRQGERPAHLRPADPRPPVRIQRLRAGFTAAVC
ncbi:MAG: sn-glycerol-3-phosphate ABC transporter ATP-binding protein UgpC [Rhizobiales bacterium]|nr:sn-glycerol-3-phosphate ABC transporter ATP-binding protein UgpC [Hyphomicrobiales bacterium]